MSSSILGTLSPTFTLALLFGLTISTSHAQFDGGVAPRVDASIPRASMDASIPRVNMDAGVAQNRAPYQQQCVSTEINIGARHPHLHQPGRPGVYLRNVCIHDLGVMLDPRASTALRGQPSFVLFRVLDVNPVTKELSLGIIPSNNPDMPHWGHPVVRDLVRSGEDLRFQRDFEEEERPALIAGEQNSQHGREEGQIYYFVPECVPRYVRGSLVVGASAFSDSTDRCGSLPSYYPDLHGMEYGRLRKVFHSPIRDLSTNLFYSPLCLYSSVSSNGPYHFISCHRLKDSRGFSPLAFQDGLARAFESHPGFVLPWRHLSRFPQSDERLEGGLRCLISIQTVALDPSRLPPHASLNTCLEQCERNARCLGVMVTASSCQQMGLSTSADLPPYRFSAINPSTSFVRQRWTPAVEQQCRAIHQNYESIARTLANEPQD